MARQGNVAELTGKNHACTAQCCHSFHMLVFGMDGMLKTIVSLTQQVEHSMCSNLAYDEQSESMFGDRP